MARAIDGWLSTRIRCGVNKREREEILRKITEMKEFALFGRTGPNLDTLCDILRAIVRALPRTEKERIG